MNDNRRRVPRLLLWLVGLWVILIVVALAWGIGNAESKLRSATRQLLEEQGFEVAVEISGRDATLFGSVATEEEAATIIAAVDAIPGVRDVHSELQVVEPPEPEVIPPRVTMRLIGDAVSLRGVVPTEELAADIVSSAEEQFGEDRVVAGISVSADVATAPWLGRIEDAFNHLGDLRSGGFTVDDGAFTITGEVISALVKDEIEHELSLVLGDSVSIISDLAVAVLPSPTFVASGSAGVVTLNGRMPDQETIDRIADATRRLHPGATIINSLQVREVAGRTWLEAIDGLVDVVTRLDPWTITIEEGVVTIAGESTDQDLVDAIGVLTEEVVAGQLSVVTDVQVDPQAIAAALTELLSGGAIFESNDVTLSDEGRLLLDQAIDVLSADPTLQLIVAGHTDDSGAPADNLLLSQLRAESVVDYLVAGGISAERLTAIGYGEEQPIADNVSEEGRARNRRIEFVIEEGEQ